jgi:hypothetical protein
MVKFGQIVLVKAVAGVRVTHDVGLDFRVPQSSANVFGFLHRNRQIVIAEQTEIGRLQLRRDVDGRGFEIHVIHGVGAAAVKRHHGAEGKFRAGQKRDGAAKAKTHHADLTRG